MTILIQIVIRISNTYASSLRRFRGLAMAGGWSVNDRYPAKEEGRSQRPRTEMLKIFSNRNPHPLLSAGSSSLWSFAAVATRQLTPWRPRPRPQYGDVCRCDSHKYLCAHTVVCFHYWSLAVGGASAWIGDRDANWILVE